MSKTVESNKLKLTASSKKKEKISKATKQESETTPATKDPKQVMLKERWNLQDEIAKIFNPALKFALNRVKKGVSCSISPCPKEDGDYLCTNVAKTWPESRKTTGQLGPTECALEVRENVMILDNSTGMIERCIVCGPGFLMFKLSMKWMAKGIHKMVKGGMDICAPKLSVEKAILYYFSGNISMKMHTGHLQSSVIGETLARILEYSRVEVIRKFHEEDVIELKMMTELLIEKFPPNGIVKDISPGDLKALYIESKKRYDEDAEFRERAQAILIEGRNVLVDLATLCHALEGEKADRILHVTDVGLRDHFEMCISDSKRAGWVVNDRCPCPLSHVGFDLVQADEYEKLLYEAMIRFKTVFVGQGNADEWASEKLEYVCGAVKYAVLKNNRLTKCTIDLDEILNEKGNTVVYLHNTHAQLCSMITKYTGDIEKIKKLKGKMAKRLTLKNNEERELGLHLLRFTEVLGEVCTLLMPHILCEYLYDLCKKFDSFYSCMSEVVGFGNEKSKLLLCAATEQVMRKCFHLLAITPIHEKMDWIKEFVEHGLKIKKQGISGWLVGSDRAPASHPTGYAPAFDSSRLKLLRPDSELSKRLYFSDLTEQQLTGLFCKGPCFRFNLSKVVVRRISDGDRGVENRSSSGKLIMFGIIQAETQISDPSHDGSFSIFDRNFDNPLVMTKPGSLSPHDIGYCSLSVSTFVKITAKLYATTYTGDGMESLSEYINCYPPIYDEDEDSDLEEEEDGKAYLDDDTLDICDENVFIDVSECFANSVRYSKLKGKDGHLDLHYFVLKYAVEAALEVVFVATSKETKVYGTVMAYYGNNFAYECSASERSLYNAMLFEIKQPSHIEPGRLNLMQSALGVPAQYSLIIDAKLHDLTSGDLILSGVCEFFVPVDGSSSVGSIKGNGCSLQLMVDWKLPV